MFNRFLLGKRMTEYAYSDVTAEQVDLAERD